MTPKQALKRRQERVRRERNESIAAGLTLVFVLFAPALPDLIPVLVWKIGLVVAIILWVLCGPSVIYKLRFGHWPDVQMGWKEILK
jgi:hypothetical protein